jgi:hypothetical protein
MGVRFVDVPMSFDEERPLLDAAFDGAPEEEAALRCKACGQLVAFERDAIEVSGHHVHSFVNPAGEAFEVGCFRRAAGCAGWGAVETFWTWFPGYAWRVALCGACAIHLGWSYEGEGSSFYGLIVARLAR